MPRSTVKYIFELRILGCASDLARRQTGDDEPCGFVAIFAHDDSPPSIHFGEEEHCLPENAESLRDENESWFFFDPFDHPEYSYIEWQNLSQGRLEELLGQSFKADDLKSMYGDGSLETFPTTWRVMF